MKKLPKILNTPVRVVIAVGAIVLAGECLIILLFEGLCAAALTQAGTRGWLFEFVDPILLSVIIAPAFYFLIFRSMRAQLATFEQQLDELRIFQVASVSRELRMKELAEENAVLRNQLSEKPANDIPVENRSPDAPLDIAERHITIPPTEEHQRDALLFMLKDLEEAREKIEVAHQEWMAALDTVDDPIFLHDKEFRVLRCNKAYQQRAGIPFHEIIGRPYYEIFPKVGAPLTCCLRAIEKEEEEEEEVLAGDAIYRSRSFSVNNKQGAHLHSVHILEDITESRRIEAALHESEEKFRKISESAQDAIIMMGADKCISFWNNAAGRIFGYTAAEVMGQELHTLIVPAPARTAFEKAYPHFQATGQGAVIGKVIEVTALRKGGEEFPVDLSISATQLNGQWHAMAIVRDITGRKRSEEMFRLMVSSLTQNIGAEFFHEAVRSLSAWLGTECVIIGEMADGARVRSLAMQLDGKAIEHYEYALPGTPCNNPAHKGYCEYPEGVCQLFPEDKGLADMGAEAYVGTPARNSNGEAVGILCAISRRKISLPAKAKDVMEMIAARAGMEIERKQTEIAIQHANRALATLGAVNHTLVHATDEDELLQAICQAIVEQRGYRLAWVGYAQHDEGKAIKIMAHAGHDEGCLDGMQLTWAETERGMAPSGRTVRSGATQVCQDIANEQQYLPWREEALKHGCAANITLPLKNGDNAVFGILNVYAGEANAFTTAEIALLEEMAGDLAFGVRSLHVRHERDLALVKNQQQLVQLAFQNKEKEKRAAELDIANKELRDSLEDTVRAIATIVEMRDPYTAGHQVRVADLATAIAKQMRLPEEQVHAIHLAGVVHDLGKIQIPAEILSKPGKITDIEYSLIKIHPQAGYDILKGINFPWPIAQMVLQHHERLDGSGYPQGLKGESILLEARILAVADVVEAMSAHRPYRTGLGIEVALEEITKNRGKFYDPQAVDACLTLFRERGYQLPS